MFCVSCGERMPGGSRYCSACGTDQNRVAGDHEASVQASAAFTGTGIDLRRLSPSDMVAGISTLLVFVSLFLPWYSSTPNGSPSTFYFGALSSGAGWFRFLILIVPALVVMYLLAKTVWYDGLRLPLLEWQLLAMMTGTDLLFVVIAFLVAPQGLSTGSAGAGLGLVAAVMATVAAGWARGNAEAWSTRTHIAGSGSSAGAAPAATAVAPAAPGMSRASAPGAPAVPTAVAPAVRPPLSGGTVTSRRAAAAGDSVRCPSCGAGIVAGNRFCTGCGAAIS